MKRKKKGTVPKVLMVTEDLGKKPEDRKSDKNLNMQRCYSCWN